MEADPRLAWMTHHSSFANPRKRASVRPNVPLTGSDAKLNNPRSLIFSKRKILLIHSFLSLACRLRAHGHCPCQVRRTAASEAQHSAAGLARHDARPTPSCGAWLWALTSAARLPSPSHVAAASLSCRAADTSLS
jgi:hypothetical protein